VYSYIKKLMLFLYIFILAEQILNISSIDFAVCKLLTFGDIVEC